VVGSFADRRGYWTSRLMSDEGLFGCQCEDRVVELSHASRLFCQLERGLRMLYTCCRLLQSQPARDHVVDKAPG
jgi:hypothetical protein